MTEHTQTEHGLVCVECAAEARRRAQWYWRFKASTDDFHVDGFPTIWILNLGSSKASGVIRWHSFGGILMQDDPFEVGPRESVRRFPQDVAYYTDTTGPVDEGYVQIISDKPVIPWGTTYLDDLGTLTVSDTAGTPTFAPMAFFRYEEPTTGGAAPHEPPTEG